MKRIKLTLLLSLLFIGTLSIYSFEIKHIEVMSAKMNKAIPVVVILPDQPLDGPSERYPVVYLLHGYGGDSESWLEIKPNLPQIADSKHLIFVCPDAKNSWYLDSPFHTDMAYESFVSTELVDYIDKHYSTRSERSSRAITGLSMGGHGAMYIAMRHIDSFGAAGSMSGGLDIFPFPTSWEIAEQLGVYKSNQQLWKENSAIYQIERIKNRDLALIIDCGIDDFFLDVNKAFHNKLLKNKIEHDFILRPGGHTHQYWNNSIDFQLLFFTKYFSSVLN